MTVAAAAPATPHRHTSTNSRSSPTFSSAAPPRNHRGAAELPAARSRQAKKLYRNVAASPTKMMRRYPAMSPRSVSGTCKNRRMGESRAYTRAVSTAVTAPIRHSASAAARRSAAMSPRPIQMANSAPAPMARPRNTEVRNVVSVNAEPTAASASRPSARPTIRVSATLYNCCSRLPAIMGSANSSRLRVMPPPVISRYIKTPCTKEREPKAPVPHLMCPLNSRRSWSA